MKNVVFPLKLRSWWLIKSELQRWLFYSMLFSVLLVMARIIYTGSATFYFLVWNLFLAFVPYALTEWLQKNRQLVKEKWKFCIAFGVWILFVPNSFYIITDLFHLGPNSVPLWFDLAMILSFAWNGLLLGILSIRQMEKMVEAWLPGKSMLWFICPVMWLNALGIYIGRYMRFNSWDIVTNPFQLITDIADLLFHPVEYKYAWGMICCFSVFMTLMYVTIKKMSKAS